MQAGVPTIRCPRGAALMLAVALTIVACRRSDEPDAYGNFEADEVVVSAEVGGRVLRLGAEEGRPVAAGAVVGLIDTTGPVLERAELQTQREAARSRTTDASLQVGVLRAELETARRDYERYRRLYGDQAATPQQLDRARGQVRVLAARIAAARSQAGTTEREVPSIDARLAQVEQRIRDSRVVNPVGGTVLTRYAEPGEFVQAGQPLYEVASLDTLTLRAYVSGTQLARVRPGQAVRVAFDVGADERQTVPGRVARVSSEAEFTPTPVQTREERVELVYAVDVRVPNPGGAIKIGMPGELLLPAPAGSAGDRAMGARRGADQRVRRLAAAARP